MIYDTSIVPGTYLPGVQNNALFYCSEFLPNHVCTTQESSDFRVVMDELTVDPDVLFAPVVVEHALQVATKDHGTSSC